MIPLHYMVTFKNYYGIRPVRIGLFHDLYADGGKPIDAIDSV